MFCLLFGPFDLAFQPVRWDKGRSTLFCNYFQLTLGRCSWGPGKAEGLVKGCSEASVRAAGWLMQLGDRAVTSADWGQWLSASPELSSVQSTGDPWMEGGVCQPGENLLRQSRLGTGAEIV